MKSKIHFGIIGCSSIAERTIIPAMKEINIVNLKMIGSRSKKKAATIAKKFSCDLYGDYKEVLERNDIDAVYISLPPALNEEWVIKSAKAGKHILCEKSATVSYNSAKRMVYECKKNDVRILEGFSFRFHPQHNKILKTVKEGVLGKLFSFYGSYGFTIAYSKENFRFKKELGGGVLNDIGCYLICASRMIFQNQPLSILCNLDIDKKLDVDVRGSMYIKYPDNCVALATFSYDTFFQSTYNVWGSDGFVALKRAFNIRKNMSALINLQTRNKIKHLKLKPADQYKLMITEFCREIRHSHSATYSFEDDLIDQAQIMEAARLSNSTKHWALVNKI